MAQSSKDTGMLLFGITILAFMGFLIWKMTNTSTSKTIVTSFTRDPKTNAIIDIVEKEIK